MTFDTIPTTPMATPLPLFHELYITPLHLTSVLSCSHTPFLAFSAASSAFSNLCVILMVSLLLSSGGRAHVLPYPLRSMASFILIVCHHF